MGKQYLKLTVFEIKHAEFAQKKESKTPSFKIVFKC